MYQFKSAIVTKDGAIYHHELTDSHSDLISHFNLKEGRSGQNFVRVEFAPKENKHADIESYALKVDEDSTPAWFDDEVREKTTGFLRGLVERMIVSDKRVILLGGAWILADGADVEATKECRIVAMSGSSKVGTMSGSSNVGTMSGSSKVGTMSGSSKVGTMSGSSKVGTMCDSSKVGTMYGSSKAPNDPTKDKRLSKVQS